MLIDKPDFKYRTVLQTVLTDKAVYKAALLCKDQVVSIYGRVFKDTGVCSVELVEVPMQVYYLELSTLQDGITKNTVEYMISPFPNTVREAWKNIKPYLPLDFKTIRSILETDFQYPAVKDYDKKYELLIYGKARYMGAIKYDDQHNGKARVKIDKVIQDNEEAMSEVAAIRE